MTVNVRAYDPATGHVETLHTNHGHRAWAKAYRWLQRAVLADHSSSSEILYLSGSAS